MSKLFIGFLSAAQLAAVRAASSAVESFAITEGQKLVATVKATSIGAVVTADIAALKDASLSGAEKFEKVVATTAPLVLSYVAGGGLSALITDVEGIARELVQSLYNDTLGSAKAASSASVATAAAVAA